MHRTPPASPANAPTHTTAPSNTASTDPNSKDNNMASQNNDGTSNGTNDGINQNQFLMPPSSDEIHRVTIKPIQFIRTAPRLYFIQMEAQFNLAGITRDQTKYNHVLGTLDPTYLTSVMDLIENPPRNEKYATIKQRIITEFQQSDQHNLRVLLNETELGDLKPSQLLRKMRELSKNALSDDALKTLWIERLPVQIRPVISIAEGNLNNNAEMADKMLEITSYNCINEVAAPASCSNANSNTQIELLTQQISELSKKFSQFANNRSRSISRDGNNKRARSKSKSNSDRPYCYYHFKFGAMARKCTEPCKFKAEAPRDSHSKN